MGAQNMARTFNGAPTLYEEADFVALIEKHGIHHNAVYELINGPYPYDVR